MLILNATTKVKCVMTDNGSLVSIMPGEVSTLIIASRNLIIAAMELGSPQEVGIILSGSYELDIAKTITGSIPYLYTDEMEAKAKLLDASIDYKSNLNAGKVNAQNEELLKIKDQQIMDLKKQLVEAEDRIAKGSNSTTELKLEYNKKLASTESALEKAAVERDRFRNQLIESQDQVKDLTDKVNLLQAQNGKISQELSGAMNKISELTEQLDAPTAAEDNEDLMKANQTIQELTETVDSLNSKLSSAKDEVKGWKKGCEERDSKVKELTNELTEASNIIDNMKSEFNKACEKFRITKDESGEWIQLEE